MKTLFLILISFTCFAQKDSKVLECDNEKVRFAVESFTMQYTYPDVIKFIYDSAKHTYITSTENLQNPKFEKVVAMLKPYFESRQVDTKGATDLKQVLQLFTKEVEYTKQSLEPVEITKP